MTLYNTKTGKKVSFGEIVSSFREEEFVLIDATEPHTASSSGRVHVRPVGSETDEFSTQEYYPEVFDLTFDDPSK